MRKVEVMALKRDDYFKNLIMFYEEQKVAEKSQILEAPEDPYGSQPADPYAPQGEVEPDMQEVPMGEPEMMPDEMGGMMGLPEMEPPMEESEQKRMMKLLELFQKLANYGDVFYESLDVIDSNLIDEENSQDLRQLKNKIFEIMEKIKDYIFDNFADEKYERALYVYILLRTELITSIRLLRKVLGLDEVILDPKRKKRSEKKKKDSENK